LAEKAVDIPHQLGLCSLCYFLHETAATAISAS